VTASVGHIAAQVVIPTATAFALFLAALWAGSRTPTPYTDAADPPATVDDWIRLVRFLAATAIGGYAAFLAIVLLFYFALGGQGPGFVADALGSGAMLALAVAVPAFLGLEAIRAAVRVIRGRRRGRRREPGSGYR
jgi:hypothetical protein